MSLIYPPIRTIRFTSSFLIRMAEWSTHHSYILGLFKAGVSRHLLDKRIISSSILSLNIRRDCGKQFIQKKKRQKSLCDTMTLSVIHQVITVGSLLMQSLQSSAFLVRSFPASRCVFYGRYYGECHCHASIVATAQREPSPHY